MLHPELMQSSSGIRIGTPSKNLNEMEFHKK